MKKNIQTILLLAAAMVMAGFSVYSASKDHSHCQECKLAFGHKTTESYTFADKWK